MISFLALCVAYVFGYAWGHWSARSFLARWAPMSEKIGDKWFKIIPESNK